MLQVQRPFQLQREVQSDAWARADEREPEAGTRRGQRQSLQLSSDTAAMFAYVVEAAEALFLSASDFEKEKHRDKFIANLS